MKLSSTQKLTLAAMSTALTILALYATYAIPYGKLTCVLLSSIFVYALLYERLYGWGILVYIASCAVGFLILPEKTYWAVYVGFFGHYGIFKTLIDSKVSGKVLGGALKLLYCNLFAMVGIVIIKFVLMLDIPKEVFVGETSVPIWLVVIAAEIAFLLFDWVYGLCQRIYEERIRPALLPRR